MTALDLGAASRVLDIPDTAFSTLTFGDIDMVPYVAPHAPATFGDFDAINIGPSEDNDGISTTEGYAANPPGDYALFLAIAATDTLDDEQVAYLEAPCGAVVELRASGGIDATSPGDVDNRYIEGDFTKSSGVTIVGFTSATTGVKLATFADGVVASGAGQSAPVGGFANMHSASAAVLVLGAWEFNATVDETTLLDTLDAISASFGVEPSPTGFEVTVTIPDVALGATFAIGGDDDVEVPDPPASGGDQEPPTWPEADFTGGGLAPIRHVSFTMPAPTITDGHVDVDGWVPTSQTDAPWAYRRLVIEGTDVTTYLDLEVGSFAYTRSEPFGPRSARIDMPQITPWVSIPSWAKAGANVSIQYLTIDGEDVISAWEGVVTGTSVNDATGAWGLDCTGVMHCSDYQLRKPITSTAPKDIGTLIPTLVNGAVARRTSVMAKVVTGITRSVLGGWEPILTGFVSQLLATAIKGGKRWTVTCQDRTPALVQKNMTTIDVDVRFGQTGIVWDLMSDATDAVNVYYGEGVNSDGGRWANWKFPNWEPDDTPLFPLGPSGYFAVGLKDSGTTSGRGVSDAQAKLGRPVTGVWNSGDVKALRRFQERAGITVDGVLGPQSWAALFDTGANTGTLDGAFIAPLAISTKVQPYRYGPDGDKLGDNPAFDPNTLRIETKIDFGEGYTKATAADVCRELLAESVTPGWVGTGTFQLDPPQKSRFLITEGDNHKVRGFHGSDLVLHTSQVDVANETVRVTVDSKGRDYTVVQSLIEARRNATDPAKAKIKTLVQGKVAADHPVYDAESPAGRMPRHAVNGGYWDVRRIPLGAFGSVVKTDWRTASPTKYCLAVFGKKVTAANLLSWVGNPLTAVSNPWEDDDLDGHGLLMAWGWKEQPLGYWPKTYSNPSGATGASITGRFVDDSSWEYASASSPWVWVAMMTAADCYAWGRFYGRSGTW